MPEAKVIPIGGPRAVPDPPPAPEPAAPWERRLAGGLAFLRRRLTGDYEVDDFGFDPDLTEHVLLPPLRPLYDSWFRVETRGLEHVPDVGAFIIYALMVVVLILRPQGLFARAR